MPAIPAAPPPVIAVYPDDPGPTVRVAVVDIETTGIDCDRDEMIELALQLVEVSRTTGRVQRIGPNYRDRESLTRPLTAEVRAILSLTDADLRGYRFDHEAVQSLLGGVDLVIAHRARFDRPFLERRFPTLADLPWACSIEQMDWRGQGAATDSLSSIATFFGWSAGVGSSADDCHLVASMLSRIVARDDVAGYAHLFDMSRLDDLHLRFVNECKMSVELAEELGLTNDESGWHGVLCCSADEDTLDALSLPPGLKLEVERVDARTRFSQRRGAVQWVVT